MTPAQTELMAPAADVAETLSGVRAVILLAGSLRSSPFRSAIQRSVLDLPLPGGETILGRWVRELAAVEELRDAGTCLRVVVDGASPLPESAPADGGLEVAIERDPFEYRGTAGVLRDVSAEYGPDDRVLVANATQLPRGSLGDQIRGLAAAGGDLSLVVPEDGIPSSLMLLAVRTLSEVPKVGFSDLKEQAIPVIGRRHEVRGVFRKHPNTAPILSDQVYLSVLRELKLGSLPTASPATGAFTESWKPVFAIVEDGAQVDPGARVHDSVVLAGARVGAGATVVRSVVGPLGVVPKGRTVLSEVVGAPRGSGSRKEARR